MTFHHNLRAFLDARWIHVRRIDEHAVRRHVLERLRESPLDKVASLHAEWANAPRLRWFIRYVEHLPTDVAPIEPEAVLLYATLIFDAAIGEATQAPSFADNLELQRLAREFQSVPGLGTYALENRLMVQEGQEQRALRLTKLGDIFLRLRGRDAIRWLVTLEVLQSTGKGDLWHLSRETLAEALTTGALELHPSALSRAIEFGVLAPWTAGPAPIHYLVPDDMRELVSNVVDYGPWHTAIRALLEDEASSILSGSVATSSAADANIEQTRLMTHEVRNALVPVRHHLDALSSTISDPMRGRVESARRGVARVLKFVDQALEAAELISEPETNCDLLELLHEAVSVNEGDERVEIQANKSLPLRAPRRRLVLALSNVIRNALQSAAAPASVRITWHRDAREVRVQVDDGGPGVAVEDRERIFDQGVTMRPGGSGFGLAFTRRLIETALRGKVWCEGSDLGGARFVISIPLESHP